MKFLGIDIKVIGSNEAILFTLKTLKEIESSFKIYTNTEYLDKFVIIANVYKQNLFCEIVGNTFTTNDKLLFSLSDMNEGLNQSFLAFLLENTIEEQITDCENVSSYLEQVESILTEDDIETHKLPVEIFSKKTLTKITDTHHSNMHSPDFIASLPDNLFDDEDIDIFINNQPIEINSESEVEEADQNEHNDFLGLLNEKAANLINTIDSSLSVKKHVKLSLFKKAANVCEETNNITYDPNTLTFLNNIIISDHIDIKKPHFDMRKLKKENFELIISELNDYIKDNTKLFKDCFELNEIYLKQIPYDMKLIAILMTNQTGLYLNKNDITIPFVLNKEIGINISNEHLVDTMSYKYFGRASYKIVYKQNYKANNLMDSLFFKMKYSFVCDLCDELFTMNTRSYFYSNPDIGDICRCCYHKKVTAFKDRIKYIKSIIRLVGRRQTFLKMKTKIETHLKHIEIPLVSYYRKNEIMRRALEQTIKKYNPTSCKICFEPLVLEEVETCKVIPKLKNEINNGNTNISTSSCGHIFHTSCIKNLLICDICPYCRVPNNFTRVFL
jgi:hypothetical protein